MGSRAVMAWNSRMVSAIAHHDDGPPVDRAYQCSDRTDIGALDWTVFAAGLAALACSSWSESNQVNSIDEFDVADSASARS